MNVNIDGVFNGVKVFLPRMLAHGEGGHIVTTSSSGGSAGGNAGRLRHDQVCGAGDDGVTAR